MIILHRTKTRAQFTSLIFVLPVLPEDIRAKSCDTRRTTALRWAATRRAGVHVIIFQSNPNSTLHRVWMIRRVRSIVRAAREKYFVHYAIRIEIYIFTVTIL